MIARHDRVELVALPRPRAAGLAAAGVAVLTRFLSSAALGAGIAVLLAVAVPTALGGRTLTVMSGSMSPAIATGDVVASRGIRASEARVGDIVTFRHPQEPSRLVTHRVRAIRLAGGTVSFVTKGDANRGSVERWSVPADGKIGRVVFRIPKLGYALAWLGGRWSRFGLLLPVILLAAFELRRLWRRDEADA